MAQQPPRGPAEVKLRPLTGWPVGQPKTPTGQRRPAPFRAKWADTKTLLAVEAGWLGAAIVVVEFDVVGGDAAFRLDGSLRATAKSGPFPGVRVSMTTVHGPLAYATDRYDEVWAGRPAPWQANVRAVALALHALRAVDRHGVTTRGEQYVGWAALPPGTGATATAGPGGTVQVAAQAAMTPEVAARVLADLSGSNDPAGVTEVLLDDPDGSALRVYWRPIARRLHPDRGGDPDLFKRATVAHAVLDRRAGESRR